MGVGGQHQQNTLMANLLARLVREDEGQDLIEYAMLAAFVSLVAIVGATAIGISLDGLYAGVADVVDGMLAGNRTCCD